MYLYEGARSDRKTFVEFLKPVRKRLRELTGQPDQLTLVLDAGASSRQNLEDLERYVTAVRPSDHKPLLSEAAAHLAEVPLSNGAIVRAWRTQRTIAGKQRGVVVVFSPQLYEGQLRGLRQALSQSWCELEEMQRHPPKSVEAAKRKVDKIRRHQYLRQLLCYEITRDGQGPMHIRLWSDWEEYRRLTTLYFGLRILITDRAEWSTAQIIQAYRGQSKVEAAFRDLKDPGMLSTRPQFHSTDKKLRVHAFLCVTAYLSVTLLHLRAKQKAAFDGGPRRLLAELAEVPCCRLIDITGQKGRPRVRWQIEEFDKARRPLLDALHALPTIG
jgi:transposase